MTSLPSRTAARATTWAASCTPWPPIPVSSSSRSVTNRRLLTEALEQRFGGGHRPAHRHFISLGLDPGPDQLQVEHTAVAGVEDLGQQAAQGYVAVAGDGPVGGAMGAHHEVAHLHETEPVAAVGDRGADVPLVPAGVDLEAYPDVEPAGQIDRIAERVHEADVGSEGIGVLQGDGDALA